ncbi:hypothetical protein CEXT_509931 [Caerostris extrusa]|uniref:Uncharacterized protein n=1 Tax=Caerostris extrusa TaxID=172846 RepID=A0AAV4MYD6_CAEEX|nr:hypothetical protein CEXT_509931 [Caerostris extrusa]
MTEFLSFQPKNVTTKHFVRKKFGHGEEDFIANAPLMECRENQNRKHRTFCKKGNKVVQPPLKLSFWPLVLKSLSLPINLTAEQQNQKEKKETGSFVMMLKPILYLFLEDSQCILNRIKIENARAFCKKGNKVAQPPLELSVCPLVLKCFSMPINLATQQEKNVDWIVCHDVKTSPLSVPSRLPVQPIVIQGEPK